MGFKLPVDEGESAPSRRVALTGANGFLGLHVRAALQEKGIDVVSVPVGEGHNPDAALSAIDGADALFHLAGVNRGTEVEVAEGNVAFARQLADVLGVVEKPPLRIVYANSIQAGNGSTYGDAKQDAAELLGEAVATLTVGTSTEIGASTEKVQFDDVRLPNIFGEFGRPFYNSVVATFSHVIAQGEQPTVEHDKELTLLHAADAADLIIGTVPSSQADALTHRETVGGLRNLLLDFSRIYGVGELPDLATEFRRNLFNTYRSFLYPNQLHVPITVHRDHRGGFFEIVRSRGGTGQTSMSTTAPGISRGDHYHRRKVERFTVVEGTAEITLRRFDHEQSYTLRVSGEEPLSVDMPTLVAHEIRNVGDSPLYTAFWTNDIFDPNNPDTIAEAVK